MNLSRSLMVGILFIPIIIYAEKESFPHLTSQKQIKVPRKAAKRFYLLNDRLDKQHTAQLTSFNKLIGLIEQDDLQISKQLITKSLKELHKLKIHLAKTDPQNHEIVDFYIDKIEKDLAEAPEIQADPELTRAIVGTKDTCCPKNLPPCKDDFFCKTGQEGAGLSGGNISESVSINDARDSTDCNSGALRVLGGVGIGGSLNVCGPEHIFDSRNSIDPAHGALVVDGGVGIGLNLNVDGPVRINDKTQSDDLNTGALVVGGGVAIGGDPGNLNVGGITHLINSTKSKDPNSGALVVDGGVGIGGDTNTKGKVKIFDTTNSTSCIDGALVVAGGEGVGGDLNVCGKVHIFDQTNSTNCKNGALVVDGGVAIGRDTYICGGLNVEGVISTNSYFAINGGSVVATDIANCNLSVGDNTNPIANGTDNTAVGQSAMQNNQLGTDDSAFGCRALTANVFGVANTIGGALATPQLFDGDGNTTWGYETLYSSLYNDYNTAIGFEALHENLVDDNTAVGAFAGHDNEFGERLTAVGFKALEMNLGLDLPIRYLGSENTAVGYQSQQYNLQGFANTSIGSMSSKYNTFGFNNTAAGASALYVNQASYNTALGAGSMIANTIGAFNTATGADSMSFDVVGYFNDSTGYASMSYAIAPFYNVVDGVEALGKVINPLRNVAIGYEAIGGSPTSIKVPLSYLPVLQMKDNVAVGFESMASNRVDANTAVGSMSLWTNLYGIHNTAVGYEALKYTYGNPPTLGSYNTAVGYQSISYLPYGYYNTAIGSDTTILYFPNYEAPRFRDTLGGYFALVDGNCDVAIGDNSYCNGSYDVVVGSGAQSYVRYLPQSMDYSVIIGYQAYSVADIMTGGSLGVGDVVIGDRAYVSGDVNVNIGEFAYTLGYRNVNIGYDAFLYGARNVQVGSAAQTTGFVPGSPGNYNVLVGENTYIYGNQNVNIGQLCILKGTNNTQVGYYVNWDPAYSGGKIINDGNTLIGAYSGAKNNYCTCVGFGCGSAGILTTAIGAYAGTLGSQTIAVGYKASSAGSGTIAVGPLANAVGSGGIAIGQGAAAALPGDIYVGASAPGVPGSTIAIGNQYAFPGSITIGTVVAHPPGTGCYIQGLVPGINPLTMVSWTPGSGLLSFGPCPACAVAAGPLEGDMDFDLFEQTHFLRSQCDKIMAMSPRLVRTKSLDYGNEIVNLGLSVPGDPEIFCPELLVPSIPGSKEHYLHLDKVIVLLINQLRHHHDKLENYEYQLSAQEDEIQDLHNKCKELTEIIQKIQQTISK